MSKHHRHGQSGYQESQTGEGQTLTDPNVNEAGNGNGNADRGVIAALKSARDVACNVRQRAVAGAKATDEAVHNHPYTALGIAVGLGVLLGMYLIRRGSRKTVS